MLIELEFRTYVMPHGIAIFLTGLEFGTYVMPHWIVKYVDICHATKDCQIC